MITVGKKHNTKVRRENGSTKVVLHGTVIVAFNSERVVLNSSGYRTATTKRRMNQASKEFGLGFTVYQRNWKWFVVVENRDGQGNAVINSVRQFKDQMEIPL